MEKQNYRDTRGYLSELFPGRLTITPQEAARVMGCDIKTVYNSIALVKNPLPDVRMTKKKSSYQYRRSRSGWLEKERSNANKIKVDDFPQLLTQLKDFGESL